MKRKRNRIKYNLNFENNNSDNIKDSFSSINNENIIKDEEYNNEYRSIIKNPFKVKKKSFYRWRWWGIWKKKKWNFYMIQKKSIEIKKKRKG